MKKLNVETKKVFGTALAVMVSVVTFFMIAFILDEGINMLCAYSDAVWMWWYTSETSTLIMYVIALTPAFLVYGKLTKACDENL